MIGLKKRVSVPDSAWLRWRRFAGEEVGRDIENYVAIRGSWTYLLSRMALKSVGLWATPAAILDMAWDHLKGMAVAQSLLGQEGIRGELKSAVGYAMSLIYYPSTLTSTIMGVVLTGVMDRMDRIDHPQLTPNRSFYIKAVVLSVMDEIFARQMTGGLSSVPVAPSVLEVRSCPLPTAREVFPFPACTVHEVSLADIPSELRGNTPLGALPFEPKRPLVQGDFLDCTLLSVANSMIQTNEIGRICRVYDTCVEVGPIRFLNGEIGVVRMSKSLPELASKSLLPSLVRSAIELAMHYVNHVHNSDAPSVLLSTMNTHSVYTILLPEVMSVSREIRTVPNIKVLDALFHQTSRMIVSTHNHSNALVWVNANDNKVALSDPHTQGIIWMSWELFSQKFTGVIEYVPKVTSFHTDSFEKAMIHYATGMKYQGEIDEFGLPHGKGEMHYEEGHYELKFKGQFCHGTRCVYGELLVPEGHRYEGDFFEENPHGRGVFLFANGDRYVGDFDQARRHGRGELVEVSGVRYVGDFEDNRRHGKGTIFFPDGAQFDGEFYKGNARGKGEYRFANGRRLVGRFENGDYVGP